ncbi:hypothetical protein MRB53_023668 [Persea americana]|uniref:Uncharacterized protein n=1 Tax=Persea americana TaxID=3435 RepID=A0ACC2LA86_PERAE|nr:hypothetical protein MRB53_023668 [Persea americana]
MQIYGQEEGSKVETLLFGGDQIRTNREETNLIQILQTGSREAMTAEIMDTCRVLIDHASTAGHQINDLVVTALQVEEAFGVVGNENRKKGS